MAMLSISHEDPTSASAQELPLWTQAIVVNTVAVTKASDSDESEVSDSEEKERARAARLDVDEDVLNTLDADADNAMRRWRNLYHQRVRCGTNKELWSFTRAVASVAESVLSKNDNSKFKGQDACDRMRVLVTEYGLCSFLELIVTQDDFYAEYPDFIMSILDIVIGIVADAKENSFVLKQSRGLIATLCENLWRSRDLLVNDEVMDSFYPLGREGVRHQLAFMMLAIIIPLLAESLGCESALRRACFVCWYHSPEIEGTTDTELQFSTIILDYAMMGSHATSKSKRLDNNARELVGALNELMHQDVLPAFGAESYLARLLITLDNPTLIDKSLEWAISSTTKSVITHPEFLKELAPSGVLGAAIECLNRQALKGKPGEQSTSLSDFVGMYTMIMTVGVTAPTRHHAVLNALIREGHLVEIIARALRVCVTEGQSHGLTYDMCLRALEPFRSCALSTNKLSAKNVLRKTLRQGFREEWYPTIAFMRQTRARASNNEHNRVLNDWIRLGEDLGFDEDAQKADYECELRKSLRHCVRAECRYHKDVCPVRVRACKGCAEARYCSSACQRIDWKDGHKSQCKRLNGEEPPEAA